MSDELPLPEGLDGPDAEPVLDVAAEDLVRSVLAERAALADGATLPDLDRLVTSRPTRHRRFGLGPALAAAATIVLVVGAVVVVASRRTEPTEVRAASSTELLEALRSERGDRSFAFEVDRRTEQSSGDASCSASTSRRGRVDPRSGLVALDLDGGELVADLAGNGSVSSTLLPDAWPIDRTVLTFTAEQLTRAGFALGPDSPLDDGGASGGSFSSIDMAERFAELRRTASSVEVVGAEQVRGVETTHVVVTLDGRELAALRAETNAEAFDAMVEGGILEPEERDRMTGPGMGAMLEGVATDDDQRVEAWIDEEGLIRRLVTTTTMRASMGAPGSIPSSSTTYTTTIEAHDYGQVEVRLPDLADATTFGSLPAAVLRPLDRPESPCGQAPVESMRDCTAAAFDEATEGRTVDQFIPLIPRTFEALVTPNAWFDACPMGMEPMTPPSIEELELPLRLSQVDEADIARLVDAAAAVPSLAEAEPNVLVYQGLSACAVVRSGETAMMLQFYDPRMLVGGLSKDAYRDLIELLADPALGFCP